MNCSWKSIYLHGPHCALRRPQRATEHSRMTAIDMFYPISTLSLSLPAPPSFYLRDTDPFSRIPPQSQESAVASFPLPMAASESPLTLLDLPPGALESILALLKVPGPSLQDLASVTRVCRVLRQLAEPVLYRSIHLRHNVNCEKFARAVEQCPARLYPRATYPLPSH